jgi:hypothetical protein
MLRIFCALLMSCTFFVLFAPASIRAASADQIELILQRLEALERENATLTKQVRNLEEQLTSPSRGGFQGIPPEDVSETPQEALDAAVAELESPEPEPARQDLLAVDLGKKARLRLIDISLDVLTVVGASSERNEVLENLQGGAHDPKRRGFTLQQAELSLYGAVDPYFVAEGHLIATEEEVEIEEAFIQTTSLPWGLEGEAGFFFTEYGHINPLHPHAWIWLDQPIINTRLFGGEGMRGTGIRAAKLLPTPWYSVFHLGVQNADGEFMASFLGGEIGGHNHGEEEAGHEELGIGGRPIVEQDMRSLEDLVYLARWENAFPLSSTWSTKFGLSGLYGPNFSGPDGETWIYGSDVLFKWVPEKNERGRPFLRLEGEVSKRDLTLDSFFDTEEGELVHGDTLKDWGSYLQALYGFRGRWSTGLRVEYATGSGANLEHGGEYPARDEDPFRDDRLRISPLVIFSASEFSRIRLQYNYDEADHLSDAAHSVWLGLEALIGAHPAHSY